MIVRKDIEEIETQLNISYLRTGARMVISETGNEKIIHNFWIAKFGTYLDYDWHNLMIFVAKSSNSYFGLLHLPDEHFNLPVVEIPNWNHPVKNALKCINLIVSEEPAVIFGGDLSYDFMVSTSSLTSYLEIGMSETSRPSITDLTRGIVKAIVQLTNIYNDAQLTNTLGLSM